MKKQIALGLIAGAVALASTAFAAPEAQARDNKQQLNQLAMQMYMQNMAKQQNLTAQQQFYGNQYGYNNLNNLNNPYLNVNNPYLNANNNPYLNQAYNGQFLAGNANFNGNQGQCQGNRQFNRKHRRNNNGIMNRARAMMNGNGLGYANGFNNNGFNNNGFNNNGFNNNGFNNNGFNNNGFNNIGYNNGFLGNGFNGLNSQSGVGQLLNRFF